MLTLEKINNTLRCQPSYQDILDGLYSIPLSRILQIIWREKNPGNRFQVDITVPSVELDSLRSVFTPSPFDTWFESLLINQALQRGGAISVKNDNASWFSIVVKPADGLHQLRYDINQVFTEVSSSTALEIINILSAGETQKF